MALNYITDDDATNGIVNTGLIDITGKSLKIDNHLNIGLLVNAPNSHVIIDKLSLEQVFKGVEFRAAKSITVKEIAVDQFYNDAIQILASNVVIRSVVGYSTIKKEYSPKNHSDFIQMFNHRTGKVVNVRIDELDFFSRNHPEQANVHLTELHLYNKIFLGKHKFHVDTHATYEYFLSAINLSNSIIGGEDNELGDLKVRVKDVKSGRWVSRNNHFIGVDRKVIERDKDFQFTVKGAYPEQVRNKRYLDQDITASLIEQQARLALTQKW